LIADDFNFAAISPSGTISIGNNTITFPGLVPLGINWNDALGGTTAINGIANTHYVYVGGTGTPEACFILSAGPGTATSGTSGGTMTINCAGNHAAGYTITSTSGGLQEAFQYGIGRGINKVVSNSVTVHQRVIWPKYQFTFDGNSRSNGVISRAADYPNGTLLYIANASCCFMELQEFAVSNGAVTQNGTAIALYIDGGGFIDVHDFQIFGGAQAIRTDGVGSVEFNRWTIASDANTQTEILVNAKNNSACTDISFTGPSYLFPGSTALGFNIAGADGLTISGIQGSQGTPWIQVLPGGAAANGFYIANTLISNNLCDQTSTTAEYCMSLGAGPAGSSVGGVIITGNKFNGEPNQVNTLFGLLITNNGLAGSPPSDVTITGNQFSFIHGPAIQINGASNNINISGNDIQCSSTAGNQCIRVASATNVSITGNTIVSSNTVAAIGLESSPGTVSIVGNNLQGSAALLSLSAIPTSFILKDNMGVDTSIPAIASAATLAMPFNPKFTLTGNVGVGTITGAWTGMAWQFIPTTAGNVVFTAGATIGNTCTALTNKPYLAFWDGTKLWISGSGC
jgi:hypothetical protein